MKQRVVNLFLYRHALSAANLSKTVNMELPDQEVPLSDAGLRQAADQGAALAAVLRTGQHSLAKSLNGGRSLLGRTRILCSPYLRTRQTAAGLITALERAGVAHDYREEIALREISFGLFDGYADEELAEHFPMEYAHYQKHLTKPGSEFWAAMPMGESRAQVADRVKGVFGTILRDSDPERDDPVQNFVVVSHGVTLRAFVMQWLHYPFEWYGLQKNPDNASVQLITSTNQGDALRYRHGLLLPGYQHVRGVTQDNREDGKVG